MQWGNWRTPLMVLVCGGVVLILSFGVRTSFGLFLAPITEELGLGREAFAFAIALQSLLWGAAQPVAGALADRHGSGRVVAVCGGLYVLGLYLMSTSSTSADLALSAGVIVGIALSGTGFPVVLAVIGRSVDASRRSLFLGIGSAAGSSGQVLVVPLGQGLIDAVGWASALASLGAISMLLVPLAAALAGRPARPVEQTEDQSLRDAVREAAAHGGYWYLTAGFFVCGFHVTFISTHLPAFIVDQGAAGALGAAALALIGLGNIIGSLTCGVLGGRYRKKYVLSALYLGRSIVMAAFVLTPLTSTSILVFAFAMGLLWLGTVPLTGGLVAEIFGLRYMATLFGFVFFSHQVGSFLGAWYGGYVFDATGSYDVVWWVAIALGVISAALHWPINDQPISRGALERASAH